MYKPYNPGFWFKVRFFLETGRRYIPICGGSQLSYTSLVDGDKPGASGFNSRYLLPINLLNSGIEADNIASNAVTTAKILAGAVTGPKIAMGSDAQGDILYHNGTSYVRLGAGTLGQTLQTQGAGANPAWATTGIMEFISTTVISNDATVEVTGLESGFDYIFSFQNLLPQTDAQRFWLRTSTDGGSTYDSGAGDYTDVDGAAASAQLSLVGQLGNATGEGCSINVTIFNPGDTTYTHVDSSGTGFNNAGVRINVQEGGARLSAADVDAVQFLFASGNMASGNLRVFRRKLS